MQSLTVLINVQSELFVSEDKICLQYDTYCAYYNNIDYTVIKTDILSYMISYLALYQLYHK